MGRNGRPGGLGAWRSHFIQQAFQGGVNTRDAAFLLTDNQARDLQNVQGIVAGAIRKRDGLATHATPADVLNSLVAFEAVSPSVLVGAGGTSLYKITAGGVVSAIKTGLTAGKPWSFAQAPTTSGQGPLYGVNGTDPPQRWDGSAGSTSAWTTTAGAVAVPNGTMALSSGNQMFIAGTAALPAGLSGPKDPRSTLYWSAIGDPTCFDPASLTGAGFLEFDPDDGAAISGIGHVGPYVLVCKPRKLWLLIDPAQAVVRRLSDNVGCIAHRSIASGAAGTYFLAEDRGVYLTNGSKLEPISDIIQPNINAIGPGLRSQAAGVVFDAHYYLSVPVGGSANDTVLDWDETLQSWWIHTFGSSQWAVWHQSGEAQLYSAKGTAAFVDHAFAANTPTDNGVAFKWRWASAWHSPSYYRRRWFPTPQFKKRLRQVRLGGSGTVDFSLATDFVTSETLVRAHVFPAADSDTFAGSGVYGGAGIFGDGPSIDEALVFGLGVANAFSMVFSATSTTEDELIYYMMALTDRRDLVPA